MSLSNVCPYTGFSIQQYDTTHLTTQIIISLAVAVMDPHHSDVIVIDNDGVIGYRLLMQWVGHNAVASQFLNNEQLLESSW